MIGHITQINAFGHVTWNLCYINQLSYHIIYHHIANKYIHTCYAQNVKFVTVSFVCASCCFNIHIGSKSYCIW